MVDYSKITKEQKEEIFKLYDKLGDADDILEHKRDDLVYFSFEEEAAKILEAQKLIKEVMYSLFEKVNLEELL